jgi:hypothetical protein
VCRRSRGPSVGEGRRGCENATLGLSSHLMTLTGVLCWATCCARPAKCRKGTHPSGNAKFGVNRSPCSHAAWVRRVLTIKGQGYCEGDKSVCKRVNALAGQCFLILLSLSAQRSAPVVHTRALPLSPLNLVQPLFVLDDPIILAATISATVLQVTSPSVLTPPRPHTNTAI